ncbi:A/G-specific adenine glycosylase [Candidatus Woesearchaeota archaeon]|nr:A/G-specific adenine glycosylase [Candidatus Woesearchaeota archaeon]
MSILSTALLEWYSVNKRDLPWRRTTDPYHVVVSEFMLQQTQVSRVVEKYHEFFLLFPTIQSLAAASPAEVIKAWSGLGYNRRALLLHRFVREVVEKRGGVIPSVPEELILLPGVGSYMAGSIASFAFNLPEPAVDVNVRRIFYRYVHGKDQGKPLGRKEEEQLWTLVRGNIPKLKSSDFHNALMDFGSLVCTRDSPSCASCPLRSSCSFVSLYEAQKEKVLYVMEKRQEKGMMENGKFVPNRIFRGRIVEFARQNEHRSFSFAVFGKVIKKDYTNCDREWLLLLCKTLQEDHLLTFSLENNDSIILRFSP